jgi:tripartite-type tricarboxylate transporter receptor subunit TctC
MNNCCGPPAGWLFAVLLLVVSLEMCSGGRVEAAAAVSKRPGFTSAITIEVGFAGGGLEQFARSIAAEAQRTVHVPVDVLPVVGNDGLEVVREFQSTNSIGHTLIGLQDAYAAASARGSIAIDPAEDWIPILIGEIAVSQLYIRSNEDRFSNWDEFVAYARAHPGLKVALLGSPLDLEALMIANLQQAFGIRLQPVAFDIGSQRYGSLTGGQTDLLIEQPGDVKALVDAGQIKPILTLWNERIRGSEQVPTAREKGASFTPLLRIRGLAVRKGAPRKRTAFLKAHFQAAFRSPAFQQHLHESLLDLMSYPQDPVAFVREQVESYRQLYRSLGVIR